MNKTIIDYKTSYLLDKLMGKTILCIEDVPDADEGIKIYCSGGYVLDIAFSADEGTIEFYE